MEKINMIEELYECMRKVKGVAGIISAIENMPADVLIDNRKEVCNVLFCELDSAGRKLQTALEMLNNRD